MTCCLCHREIDGDGNSPWPIDENEQHRCCDECNWAIVVPARMEMMEHDEESR